jgi:hypothetical protein
VTRTEIIEITDPKDYQPGDHFYGVSERSLSDSTLIRTVVSGPLKSSGLFYPPRLYAVSSLSFVDSPGAWADVKVTREVEVPPTLEETLTDLPRGSVVYIDNMKKDPRGRGTWVYQKDEGWWVSSGGTEFDSAQLANLIENHGDNRGRNEFRYLIINRDEVTV